MGPLCEVEGPYGQIACSILRVALARCRITGSARSQGPSLVILTSTDRRVTMLASYARTDYDSFFLERLWFSSESHFLFSMKSSLSLLCLHRACMIHLFVLHFRVLPYPFQLLS